MWFVGKASRRKRDTTVVEKRIRNREDREGRVAEQWRALLQGEADSEDHLRAFVFSAPAPKELDELLRVNDVLTGRGWTLEVHMWDGIMWAAPGTLDEVQSEEVERSGGFPITTIATDVFFERPAYLIEPAYRGGAQPQRFFTSIEEMMKHLALLEQFAVDDDVKSLWDALGAAVSETMPDRGDQIAQITENSNLPYL
jgi:hypothetical protein